MKPDTLREQLLTHLQVWRPFTRFWGVNCFASLHPWLGRPCQRSGTQINGSDPYGKASTPSSFLALAAANACLMKFGDSGATRWENNPYADCNCSITNHQVTPLFNESLPLSLLNHACRQFIAQTPGFEQDEIAPHAYYRIYKEAEAKDCPCSGSVTFRIAPNKRRC
jgi:hypothetical protein